MKLLYVEDNTAVARALAKALRAQGHQVTLAHDCATARAATTPHDLGFFDLTLPDGDGIALCEALLQARRIAAALFCSGSVDDLLLERARRTAPVISKEASLAELCAAIEAAAAGRA